MVVPETPGFDDVPDMGERSVPHAVLSELRASSLPASSPQSTERLAVGSPAVLNLAENLASLANDPATANAPIPDWVPAQFFHDLGFGIFPQKAPKYDENSTYSYTYNIGDVNDDGWEDAALEVYCVDETTCAAMGDFVASLTRWLRMGFPSLHHLFVLSGRDGEEIWNRTLQPPDGVPFVVGSLEGIAGLIPNEDGTRDFLIYRYTQSGTPVAAAVEHTLYRLSGRTANALWNYTKQGHFVWVPDFVTVGYDLNALNLAVVPILQVPDVGGARILPPATRAGLTVQGIGFHFSKHALIEVLEHKPIEWAAGLDLASGKELWNVKTFEPSVETNVLPLVYFHHPRTPYPYDMYGPGSGAGFANSDYWRNTAYGDGTSVWAGNRRFTCCFDLTGDGLPDLLFVTQEWPRTIAQPDRPYFVAYRLILLDGQTGERRFDLEAERSQTFQGLYYNLLGDATGDGVSDFLVHGYRFGPDADYRHTLSARNGKDGAELWRIESLRELRSVTIGDADGDRANDVLVFGWFIPPNWYQVGPHGVASRAAGYSATNVTFTTLKIVSGRDGSTLWETVTVAAPIDLAILYENARLNGLPDFDADGVGDILVDDPILLTDLTVIHQHRFLSGRGLEPIFDFVSVGLFSFPARLGDLTGDGRDDFALLNGDVVDLWITVYDGARHEALWSTRSLAPRISDYLSVLPRYRFHVLDTSVAGPSKLLMNLQLTVRSSGGGFGVSVFTHNQLASYNGPNGSVDWARPRFWNVNFSSVIPGASPATQQAVNRLESLPPTDAAVIASFLAGHRSLFWGASFSVSLGAMALAGLRRRRP